MLIRSIEYKTIPPRLVCSWLPHASAIYPLCLGDHYILPLKGACRRPAQFVAHVKTQACARQKSALVLLLQIGNAADRISAQAQEVGIPLSERQVLGAREDKNVSCNTNRHCPEMNTINNCAVGTSPTELPPQAHDCS